MIKKSVPWFVFILFTGMLISGFLLKDDLNNYLSEKMKEQSLLDEEASARDAYIDSLYNYTKNGSRYEITFLEFGARGCSACKRMEKVMDDIRHTYPEKVNVVFVNIILPENQDLMKSFGIAAIPAQILLNNKGKELFRHTGYCSSETLVKEFMISKK